jgi:hypothetical protein
MSRLARGGAIVRAEGLGGKPRNAEPRPAIQMK